MSYNRGPLVEKALDELRDFYEFATQDAGIPENIARMLDRVIDVIDETIYRDEESKDSLTAAALLSIEPGILRLGGNYTEDYNTEVNGIMKELIAHMISGRQISETIAQMKTAITTAIFEDTGEILRSGIGSDGINPDTLRSMVRESVAQNAEVEKRVNAPELNARYLEAQYIVAGLLGIDLPDPRAPKEEPKQNKFDGTSPRKFKL